MAHLDLHEQEQVNNLKYWWKLWGKYLLGIVVIGVVAYSVSTGYSSYQAAQARQAVAVYQDFVTQSHSKQSARAFALADELVSKFSTTEYAALASITVAKLAFVQHDYAKAEHYLQWAKDHSIDQSLKSVALIRLASVYTDEGKFEQARAILRTKHDLAFDGLFYEARGDVYMAMGDLAKARDAYKEGLQKSANDPTTQQALQMKLQVIGE